MQQQHLNQTTATGKAQPAGTIQPRPGLGLLLIHLAYSTLLVLIFCWAALRSMAATAPPDSLAAAIVEGVLRTLTPSQYLLLWQLALCGLCCMAGELLYGMVLIVFQSRAAHQRVQQTSYLRIRLPLPANQKAHPSQSQEELFRALHAALAKPGQADHDGWSTFLLGTEANRPAALGFIIAGTAQKQARLLAAFTHALAGLAPEALIEEASDRLLAHLPAADLLAWREFGLALPPHYPLRQIEHWASEPLGPLLAALQPRGTVLYTEYQLVIKPISGTTAWLLDQGWRGHAVALKLRLEARATYALSGDLRAIESKLAGSAYLVVVRIVALASGPGAAQAASAALDSVADALGEYQARTAQHLQRFVPIAGGIEPASKQKHSSRMVRALGRGPHFIPAPQFLLPFLPWRAPAILSSSELAGLWYIPGAALKPLISWLPCRYLPAPPHAYAINTERLVIGSVRQNDGTLVPAGPELRDLNQILHLTAGMGTGKTRLLANLCRQLLPRGFTLIDGKGDDQAGSLVAVVRSLLPLEDEARCILLDVLDYEWPVGLNPLASATPDRSQGADLAVGQVLALFARLDPETWGRAAGMQQYVQMATLLVLEAQPHATLAHVKQVLLDQPYRKRLLEDCHNIEVHAFWTEIFPQLGDSQRTSRDALLRRFDMLLTTETTRYLVTQAAPTIDLLDAIEGGLIVLVPLPDMALGGLAGAVGMLLFQAFVRAAFARSGSDQNRTSYPLLIDEFQVLLKGDTTDAATAITRLRSLGIPSIYAHQALTQLGDLAPLMAINAGNRIILQTQEPDASTYARLYAHTGITASDISGQNPLEHQYAMLRCGGVPAGPFSLYPLPWPEPETPVAAAYRGPDWRLVLPSDHDPADLYIIQLVYGAPQEQHAVAALARLGEPDWERLIRRWDAIRQVQRRHILRNPGCIPDRFERQRWLSRLLAARPRIFAATEYARARSST